MRYRARINIQKDNLLMSHHISTQQVVNYLNTKVNKLSVDGIIYDSFSIDDKELNVGSFIFPLEYFDIAGMDPNSFIFVSHDHSYHRIQCHDDKNVTLKHPEWTLEDYDATKVKHKDMLTIMAQEQ